MGSYWNAPICDRCWDEQEGRWMPVRMRDPDREYCAECGEATESGIYRRQARK